MAKLSFNVFRINGENAEKASKPIMVDGIDGDTLTREGVSVMASEVFDGAEGELTIKRGNVVAVPCNAESAHAVYARRSGNATQSIESVKSIRRERADGATLKTLAEKYGLSTAGVNNIVNGKTWEHVPFEAGTTPSEVKAAREKAKAVKAAEKAREALAKAEAMVS